MLPMRWKLPLCATIVDVGVWLAIYTWGPLTLDSVVVEIKVFAALHFPSSLLAALVISLAPASDWVVFPAVACGFGCSAARLAAIAIAFSQTFFIFYGLGVYLERKKGKAR